MANNPLNNKYCARATWDLSNHPDLTATPELTAGSYSANTAVWIPEGALILNAFYHVTTTFIDTDVTDNATLALGYTGATGAFVAAIAITGSTFDAGTYGTLAGTPILSGFHASNNPTALQLAVINAASWTALTANKELLLTVAVDTVNTGKLDLYVEYVLTGDLS